MDKAKNAPAGYDPRRAYRLLVITVFHVTRDMSIAGGYSKDFFFDLDDPKNADGINLGESDGGIVKVKSVTDDAIVLKWGNEEFCVTPGSKVSTDSFMVHNPYLSYDSVSLTFSCREVPSYKDLLNRIIDIGYRDMPGNTASVNSALDKEKKEILNHVERLIELGNTGLYVAQALLQSSTSWRTCKITDSWMFEMRLLSAIGKGCLVPTDRIGWDWMKIATKYNDPGTLMENKREYKSILAKAADSGVDIARDILDSIDWRRVDPPKKKSDFDIVSEYLSPK